MTQQQQYINLLRKYLESRPDILLWVTSYVAYCHSIDDIIDREDYADFDFILKTFRFAITVYSAEVYVQNIHILRPLVIMAHDNYRDSVHMERFLKDKQWSQRVGDILRQSANDVILACIDIVHGQDIRNEAALELRKLAYDTHHTFNGLPA